MLVFKWYLVLALYGVIPYLLGTVAYEGCGHDDSMRVLAPNLLHVVIVI